MTEAKLVLLELLCVAAAVAFCIVTWWPAALLVISAAAGFTVFVHRGVRK